MSAIIDNPFNDDWNKWIKERVENGETVIVMGGRRNGKTLIADYLNAKEVKENDNEDSD